MVDLLERQADIDARDNTNNTPLLLAGAAGMTDVCLKLIEAGCDKNAVNDTDKGAWLLASRCSRSTARRLIRLGAQGRTRKNP